jgi:hypothetical protein
VLTLDAAILSGCGGWQDFDNPHPEAAVSWKKSGVSVDETRRILRSQCGYEKTAWTVKLQMDVDRCMLSRDFKFVDIKYGGKGMCDFPQYQHLPSCESIINSTK